MANTHEHIEHAEHGAHATDPFDKRVAVSIAIVAAVLAGISMLGHRKHNEVLRLTTEANILHTHATDTWGEYQAVNIRDHEYKFTGKILTAAARADPKLEPGFKPLIDEAKAQNTKYDKRLPKLKDEAEDLVKQANGHQTQSTHAHHQADRLDYAHLAAELGIVLCSLTLLTKRKVFWFAGLASVAVALGLTVSSYMIPHESHGPPSALTDQHH